MGLASLQGAELVPCVELQPLTRTKALVSGERSQLQVFVSTLARNGTEDLLEQ